MSNRVALAVASLTGVLSGCGQSMIPMRPGTPLEVRRGYCALETTFKQHNQELNRDSVMKYLGKNARSRPHLEAGHAYAVGSIVATVLATPAVVVGAYGKDGLIEMSDGTSTALLVGGVVAAASSWVLCIASDGEYVAGAHAYNAQVRPREEAPEPTGTETWR